MNEPIAGHMHWEIADWCNYRCSYCCEGRFAPKTTAKRYVTRARAGQVRRFLASLEKNWTVRLSAGEPSSHPRLFELVSLIVESGHRVAMETNLSLPLERYARFAALAGERLAYLHASLHLEHAPRAEFLAKCLALRDAIGKACGRAGLYAASVATRDNLDALREASAFFKRNGVPLHIQRGFGDGVEAVFPVEELDAIKSDFERPAVPAESPFGRPCLAGRRWLIVDIEGNIWRCHAGRGAWAIAPPKKIAGGYLGNVTIGIARLDRETKPCAYAACHCPGGPILKIQ